jgi:Delta24-sterol reductase
MEGTKAALQAHSALVAQVSTQVKAFHTSKTPFRIYHGSTNSTRTVIRDPTTSLDISGLNNILFIDTDSRIACVEPNVPMDALVQATLAHGLVPLVVPEFPGITAGGGFAGSAGESSSFKYGFLDATVVAVEVVLGDGTVRNVRRDGCEEEKELFLALAGTLGTLGVVTRLDIQLIEAKPFVEVTYRRVNGFAEAKETIENAMMPTEGNEFVDCIMFSANKGAVITGRMVDTSETHGATITTFSRPSDEWCFLHVEAMISRDLPKAKTRLDTDADDDNDLKPKLGISTSSLAIDCVPLKDYLFRYDRGAFWVGKYGCAYFYLPFIKPIRTLLDGLFHTREMYIALHASKTQQVNIVEDLAVPFKQIVPFLEYLHDDFEIYPLWLCPLKFKPTGLRLKHFPEDTDMMLNVGVWGPWKKKHTSFEEANRALEAKTKELHGVKWLYAQMFYTREEFWDIYDKGLYDRSREKFAATNLPDVFEKIKQPPKTEAALTIVGRMQESIASFWRLRGIYGLFMAWMGSDYILKKS